MPVDPASRYARQPTITVSTADPSTGDTTSRLMSAPRVAPAGAFPVRGSHSTRAGDRLDLLARSVLGDSTGWWRIADVNPWLDPTRLERPGQTIDLPGG